MKKLIIFIFCLLLVGCQSSEIPIVSSVSPETTSSTTIKEEGLIKDFINENAVFVGVNITAFSRWNVEFKNEEFKKQVEDIILNTPYFTEVNADSNSGGYGIEFIFNAGLEINVHCYDTKLDINIGDEQVTNQNTMVQNNILVELFPNVLIDKEIRLNDRVLIGTLLTYETDDYQVAEDGLSMGYEWELTKEEFDLIKNGGIEGVTSSYEMSDSNTPMKSLPTKEDITSVLYLEYKMDEATSIYYLNYKIVEK